MGSSSNFIAAFSTVFFVLGIGFTLQRLRPMGKETINDLSKLVIDILLPFFLFYTTATTATLEAMQQAPWILLAGVLIPTISFLFILILYKPLGIKKQRRAVFNFVVITANTGFLGIPICEALFGPTGAFYAVIYDFGLTIIMSSLGVWLLNGGKLENWKSLLFNPLVIGTLLGLAWAFSGWNFPIWIIKPFEAVGSATLPIALLVAGAQVGAIRSQSSTRSHDMPLAVVLRLVFIPLMVFLLFSLLKFDSISSRLIIIQAGMPTAISTTIMAKTYGSDADFTARVTLWTTLCSILTLPLLAWLVL